MIHRSITGLLLLLSASAAMLVPGSAARAQEVFRASWTIQDKGRGLHQEIARNVIERANDWLTRDDADAPVARLDDPLRVTIVGELSPASGQVRSRLRRLVLGTIVIDTSFGEFLDTGIIASLVRRDHFWRDEQVVVYNESLSPISGSPDILADSTRLLYDRAFGNPVTPRIRLALDESTYRLSADIYAWAGIGFEEIALPDFSYGRARLGLAYDGLKVWGEIPAAFGTRDNAIMARGLEAAYGLGVSFEDRWVGGAVSIADVSEPVGASPVTEGPRYYLSTAALIHGTLPLQLAMLDYMPLRVKLGLLYHRARLAPTEGNDNNPPAADEAVDRLKLMTRIEFAAAENDGSIRRRIALGAELFGNHAGNSFTISYQEQLFPTVGVRVAAAAHGLFGERDPFLPPFSFTISPIISIW